MLPGPSEIEIRPVFEAAEPTVERHDDLTMVVVVGGEKVYIDTMPETLRLAYGRGRLMSQHH